MDACIPKWNSATIGERCLIVFFQGWGKSKVQKGKVTSLIG